MAIIRKSTISLQDVAYLPIGIKNYKILQTPDAPTQLHAQQLQALLIKNNTQKIKIIGTKCLILPFRQSANPEELETSLQKELIQKTGWSQQEFRLRYLGKAITFPKQNVDLRWSNFARNLGPGQRIFPLDIYFRDKKVYSYRLLFKLSKKIRAAIATKNILRGQKLKSGQNYRIQNFFSQDKKSRLISKNIDDYTALSGIEAGNPILPKNVRNIFTIQRGSIVDILYIKGNIFIKGRGKAKTSGNIGDTIRVTGHSNKKTISAEVVSPGKVLIK